MKILSTISIAAIVFLFCGTANSQKSDKTKSKKIEFAANVNAPVISYDTTGGYRRGGEKKPTSPKLQVWPSGKIICGATGNSEEVESRISEKKLQALLEFLVNEKNVYDISWEKIVKKIEAADKKLYGQNMPTTSLEINLKRGIHKYSIESSSFANRVAPGIEMLERAVAVEKRLNQLAAESILGDERDHKSALETANKALKREGASSEELKMSDLMTAQKMKGDMILATFQKVIEEGKSDAKQAIVTYSKRADGKESASVRVLKLPK